MVSRAPAKSERAHDPVADREPLGAGPDLGHSSRKFGGGRKRRLRLELIFALDDEGVEEIQRGIGDIHQHLALARDRRLDVFELERLRRAKRGAYKGFHLQLRSLLIVH